MTSISLPFKLAIALNQRYGSSNGYAKVRSGALNVAKASNHRRRSIEVPGALLVGRSISPLFFGDTLNIFLIGKGALIGKAEML
jgi:hypothetical protein